MFDIDITVSRIEIEDGSTFEIRLYELQIKSTCTIYKLISIMLSQKDINVSRYRVILVYCGKHLHDFQVNAKLSDHGIRQDSVITMMMSSTITGLMSNSVSYNKKRPVNDNLVKDVKPDKRLKGHKSNVTNDDSKDQSLDNILKQINVLIKKTVVSYSTISDRNRKLTQLILDNKVSDKIDFNITLPYISSILESMSKVKVKDSIVEDSNI